MNVRENIRLLRRRAGLTQAELAKKLHMKQYSISDYELGRTEPTLHALILLSDYFHVSIDFLLGHKKKAYSGESQLSQSLEKAKLDQYVLAIYEEIKDLKPEDKKKILEGVRFLKSTYLNL